MTNPVYVGRHCSKAISVQFTEAGISIFFAIGTYTVHDCADMFKRFYIFCIYASIVCMYIPYITLLFVAMAILKT